MIYLLVAFLLLFLSFRYDICGKNKDRIFWYNVVLVLLILIAGLRWRLGSDTVGTLGVYYEKIPLITDIVFDGDMVKYPSWTLLNLIIYTLGGKFFIVQLVQSSVLNILLFKYIKKHSRYIFTCVFFYFIWMYTSYNMEEMKASMAMPFCLFANDFFLEKRWTKGFLFMLIGCSFHFSICVLLVTPLLLFLRVNKLGLSFLIFSYFLGYFLQKILADYIMLFEFSDEIYQSADTYTSSDKYSTGMSPFKIFLFTIPVLFYSLFSFYYVKVKGHNTELIRLEPYLMIGLVFCVLQINMYIFYRYFHLYIIYLIFFFAQAFVDYIHNTKNVSIPLLYIRNMLIIVPLLFLMLWPYVGKYYRYYPYSSVIERKLDRTREMKQREYNPDRSLPHNKWY
jgi:hypothetical protein